MMKAIVLSLLLLAAAGSARASVLYSMVDRTCSVQASGTVSACSGAYPAVFQLTVSDAAVARGSFDLVGRGLPVSLTGDVSDLISVDGAIVYRPDSGIGFAGDLAIHARFAADGTILSLSFYGYGINDGALLSGTADSFGGWFDDEGLCQHDVSGRSCTETGRLTTTHLVEARADVDEPATTPLLLTALILMLALWRQRPPAWLGRSNARSGSPVCIRSE